ncbi:MAG: hypothetical protein QS748_07530 [Candidatus Endonucleobacter bathymodioli]|uniref:Uncharacterized protein n=1 Tax=Candidatus Endonucleibacter bathymodioli TaxID=539814 RepID=A0AA90NTI7_9GAMM|nr:hypothetical protein [Candidatus Endonucleobacter bathymodioli]
MKINNNRISGKLFSPLLVVFKAVSGSVKKVAGKRISGYYGQLTKFSLDEESVRILKDRNISVKNTERLPKKMPVNGDVSFHDFWEKVPGSKSYMDTIDHQLMKVKDCKDNEKEEVNGGRPVLSGTWHVKGPGLERPATRFKRMLQRVIYNMIGHKYKGRYYDNPKLLIQKEVLATNVYKIIKGNAVGGVAMNGYGAHYTVDRDKGRYYGAFKHLDGFMDASAMNPEDKVRMCDQPATELVLRRYLLGDEDYLKMDNYMYDRLSGSFHSIDFGMSFYNQSTLDPDCDFDQFKAAMLKTSRKHRLQYNVLGNGDNLLKLVKSKNADDTDDGIKNGLKMIALLTDKDLEEQVAVISNPKARAALLLILVSKCKQAQCILYRSFPDLYPRYKDTKWPEYSTRKVMNLVV